jgi:hypothetical protein
MWHCVFGDPVLLTLAQREQCVAQLETLKAWLDVGTLVCVVIATLALLVWGLCAWRLRVLRRRQRRGLF